MTAPSSATARTRGRRHDELDHRRPEPWKSAVWIARWTGPRLALARRRPSPSRSGTVASGTGSKASPAASAPHGRRPRRRCGVRARAHAEAFEGDQEDAGSGFAARPRRSSRSRRSSPPGPPVPGAARETSQFETQARTSPARPKARARRRPPGIRKTMAARKPARTRWPRAGARVFQEDGRAPPAQVGEALVVVPFERSRNVVGDLGANAAATSSLSPVDASLGKRRRRAAAPGRRGRRSCPSRRR